ncbi:hypothetical protein [Terribacillus saccharophilus]|uniref:hypothetical protein n=1 Tax=Terribacillus saccharophilus TaxID=361277 RepID=UPI003D2CD17E
MAIKKQVIVFSILFDEDETHAKSAAEAISHRLYNEEGIMEWDYKIKREEELTADIDDEDLKED